MASTKLIGIDVGTTALKALLIESNGQRLAEFSKSYAISRPKPGHAEQDPDDWMNGLLEALRVFSDGHDLTGLAGIGICSQVNTHVFVDAKGDALLPAMIWQDGRCADDAARLDRQVTMEQKTAWFGGPMPIDASHALARMAHVARLYPELYARTRHVLLPKDYCVMKLTGAVGADPMAAVGLVDRSLNYIDPLVGLVPQAGSKLPPLFSFTHRAGTVSAGMPCEGVPVVVGAMDAWAGMFGVGVVADGEAMYQSGTSEIPGIVSSQVVPTPGVIVFPPYKGIVMHAAPTQSGGAALAWLATILGRSPQELSALAERVPVSPSVPLFLPHLQGERAPLWDSRTRGVFARLDAATGAGEMARGVMEGVAFSVRLAFDALEASAGRIVDVVNIGGGGARSDLWCQIRADTLDKTLRRTQGHDCAALGAAMLAGVGCGLMPSLQDAVRQLARFDRTFVPDPSLRSYYDGKFAKFTELYARLKPFNEGYGEDGTNSA